MESETDKTVDQEALSVAATHQDSKEETLEYGRSEESEESEESGPQEVKDVEKKNPSLFTDSAETGLTQSASNSQTEGDSCSKEQKSEEKESGSYLQEHPGKDVDQDCIHSQEFHEHCTEQSESEHQELGKATQHSEPVEVTDQDVSLEPVSVDESVVAQPEAQTGQGTDYTESISLATKPCDDQAEQVANDNVYTEIQSPESISLATKPCDDQAEQVANDNVYTEIQSPETSESISLATKPCDDQAEQVANDNVYTEIQSPETSESISLATKPCDDQAEQVANDNVYTEIQSPETSESISLATKPCDDQAEQVANDNVYTEIQSPETSESISLATKPCDDQAEQVANDNVYTEIQSPEAKSSHTGPSDDREDISDGELDLPLDSTKEVGGSSDVKAIRSCAGEAQDMKVDESVKSDAGSLADDASRVSKGASEDLEAVSEDELPEASHTKTKTFSSKLVVEGGEDVSSEDEEPYNSTCNLPMGKLSPDNVHQSPALEPQQPGVPPIEHEPVSPTALPDPESPVGLAEPVSPTDLPEPVSPTDLAEPVSPTALVDPVSSNGLPELTTLDAEPISDDEVNSGLAEEEDGEAGEIKSPTEDITSPPSSPEPSGANLGEVEPVSADDTNDTDGELPSGDEDDPVKLSAEQSKHAKFESIESEDEGDLDAFSASLKQSTSKNLTNAKADGYMESISDEETVENNTKKSSELSFKPAATGLDGESGKKVPAPNFNEHQVELDYEETEADDAEVKLEETRLNQNINDATQEGKLKDSAASDKDEGELSDDDCEEGEIKEPGTRKPFVKPMCRFFQRGNCTWGVNCRFLHPGVNDKGNYQMIEIPGFQPTGVHARLGGPGPWQEPQAPVEEMELPPPPLPDTPPPETAWERGLRIAKEQRKKANERKEQEPDFEDKRLNLSVDEERELNKENERVPRIIPKDPYYDQQAFEEDEYYKISRDPWQTGHYENFEVRYNREPSFSPPPYREKAVQPGPPPRYSRPYSSPPPPQVDKFGRDRMERREEYRAKPAPPPPVANNYPSPPRRPDEWVDPWRRQTTRKNSKSPTRGKHKRSHSRGRRGRRSVSDSSNSSRSASGSSSGSSRSSRSYSGSSGSSSHSRSPEPAPPGVDRHERYQSPSRDQPRSAVSVRGRGAGGYHNSFDSGFRRDQHGYGRMRGGGGRGGYQGRPAGGRGRGGGPGGGGQYQTNFGGPGGRGADGYPNREGRGRPRQHSPPDRPLPYVRPRPRSASSRSSSSGSRSRSRSRSRPGRDGRGRGSSSRSSSGSSSSRSSSSSSAGSADSEHLYRDLGSPGKSPAVSSKKKRVGQGSHKDRHSAGAPQPPPVPGGQRHSGMPPPPVSASQQQRHHVNLEHIPIPRDAPRDGRSQRDSRETRDSRLAGTPAGRSESRYASRNAPQAPAKAKDPLKVVGQKSNIKLTLLPKQQQSSLGSRPNPLDSPPRKRRISDRDTSPQPVPPAKRLNLPVPQASALRLATEKAAKIQMRQDKGRPSPPPSSSSHHTLGSGSGLPLSSSSSSRARAPVSPQKQSSSGLKSRGPEPSLGKTAPKMPSGGAVGGGGGSASMGSGSGSGSAPGGGAKTKKSMSSRREELLKQLKAVEDAIARKKTKLT